MVDGQDQADPGDLAHVLEGTVRPASVALGQPVGQAEVGKDDPLAQPGVPGDGVGAQPRLDARGGGLVAGADVGHLVRGVFRCGVFS